MLEEKMIDCSGMNLLVAEDSMIEQIIVREILERLGAVVEIAADGEECFEKFSSNPDKYKMIFMDVEMLVLNGLEATKKIRSSGIKNADRIPIIAMTGNTSQEDVAAVFDAGMNEHLGKPINVKKVIAAIKKLDY